MKKKSPSWLAPAGAAAGVLFLLAVAVVLWWRPWVSPRSVLSGGSVVEDVREVKLYIYFPPAKRFDTRTVKLAPAEGLTSLMKSLTGELCREPKGSEPSLWPMTLPVRGAYALENGTLILDFENEVKYNQFADAYAEWRAVQGVVQTVLRNFKDFRRVKMLVGGQEEDTLAGHVDISRPIDAEMTSL